MTTLDNSRDAGTSPFATSTTTPPRDTFHEVKVTPGAGVLVYWPQKNSFLALFPEEYLALYAEADEHSKKIQALQTANREFTEASLALREAHRSGVQSDIANAEAALKRASSNMESASKGVKKALQPLSRLDAKEGTKMVELLPLKQSRKQQHAVAIYVKSSSLRQILVEKRICPINDEKKAAKAIFKEGKLNTDEIKQRIAKKVQDAATFEKKWKLKPEDADEYSGTLSSWARTMNGDVALFLERKVGELETLCNIDPKDPSRQVDLSAEAQLMRYTGGAGLEMNFKPLKGNLTEKRDGSWPKTILNAAKTGEFGIKANAQASFAIAEGRVRTKLYLPHFAGWHATAKVATQTFDFGYWRFYGDLVLTGGSGASLAVELGLQISYDLGKQRLRGGPAAEDSGKNGNGVNAELDAFAGGSATVDAKGALQWLNPEGAASNGEPLTSKQNDPVAEFKDVASIDPSVSLLAGLGVKGAFRIGHEDGKFVIYVKMGACLGIGFAKALKFQVGTATIGEFLKCVAYQLKRADYHEIADSIEADAYTAYCQVKYLVSVCGEKLEDFVNFSLQELQDRFAEASEMIDKAIQDGNEAAEQFVRRVRSELKKQTGSWLGYAPPEVMGKLQRQIAMLQNSTRDFHQQSGELMALSLNAPQTLNHLETVAERMTEHMGDKQDARTGLAMIEQCLRGTLHQGSLLTVERRLAQAETLVSKPFIWNSEPEFVAARIGIEHPMYRMG